jgi:hypothetical protein
VANPLFADWEKTSPVSIRRGDYSIARYDGPPAPEYLIFKREVVNGIPWWECIQGAKQKSAAEAVEWVNAEVIRLKSIVPELELS